MQSRYPKAQWRGDGKSGGYYTGGPWKGVLHTTETSGLPGYSNGYTAPHLTYDPISRLWYQHTTLMSAARALRNESGGTQTNRDRVLQVEIICYSQKSLTEGQPTRQWVGHLDADALADIREFMLWSQQEFGITFAYPTSDRRLDQSEWDNYGGWCGHKHVPENTHWDPGALDIAALMNQEEQEGEQMIQPGDEGPQVVTIQEALIVAGIDLPEYGADGDFGGETTAGVEAFQAREGLAVTGKVDGVTAAFLIPGPQGQRGKRGFPGEDGKTPDLTGYTIVPPVV